ncbi:MAG: hypothetical protein JWL86_330 [Rhizobium sp.]|nr:hypothetical protein [Rhizobium sp.]
MQVQPHLFFVGRSRAAFDFYRGALQRGRTAV